MTDPRDGQTYCHNYLGVTYQWLTLFREGGATLPWSEDWAWMTPIGSQQMVTLLIDVMRSSVIKHAKFDRDGDPYAAWSTTTDYQPLSLPPVDAVRGSPPLMMYIMPHSPSNHPASWRRQLYGDVSTQNPTQVYVYPEKPKPRPSTKRSWLCMQIAHGIKIIDLFFLETSTSG